MNTLLIIDIKRQVEGYELAKALLGIEGQVRNVQFLSTLEQLRGPLINANPDLVVIYGEGNEKEFESCTHFALARKKCPVVYVWSKVEPKITGMQPINVQYAIGDNDYLPLKQMAVYIVGVWCKNPRVLVHA